MHTLADTLAASLAVGEAELSEEVEQLQVATLTCAFAPLAFLCTAQGTDAEVDKDG